MTGWVGRLDNFPLEREITSAVFLAHFIFWWKNGLQKASSDLSKIAWGDIVYHITFVATIFRGVRLGGLLRRKLD